MADKNTRTAAQNSAAEEAAEAAAAAAAKAAREDEPAEDHQGFHNHIEPDHYPYARRTVNRYALYTGGAGLIPIPVIDIMSISALQLKMIKDLGDIYGVKFRENVVKASVGVLLGGVASMALVKGTTGFLKSIPLVGGIIGGASVSLYSSAMTIALGKVFIKHFESGGTFLTFNAEKYKDFYKKEFGSAKEAGRHAAA